MTDDEIIEHAHRQFKAGETFDDCLRQAIAAARAAESREIYDYLDKKSRALYAEGRARGKRVFQRDASLMSSIAADLRLGRHLPSREDEIAEAIEKAAADLEAADRQEPEEP